MNPRLSVLLVVATLVGVVGRLTMHGQVVNVSTRLDDTSLNLGQSTVLHVYAQISPQYTNASQIFSWYINVLDGNPQVAALDYGHMTSASSDNDPTLSSKGVTDPPSSNPAQNRLAIYNTFMNLPGAGTNRVELLTIPVITRGPGQVRFQVLPGSGVPALSSDFVVLQTDSDQPLTGGDYSAAGASLLVNSPAISISDASVVEGNTGSVGAVFNVSLSQSNSLPVTVLFATSDGTAITGSDYAATNGVLTFLPGTTSQTVTVKVLGDLIPELAETFFLNLSQPTNAIIARPQGVGTIIDDDLPLPAISISNATVVEGNSGTVDAKFSLTLSSASSLPVTVNYATADVTAIAGTDYVATNGVVTFDPGVTSQSVIVKVKGDTISEATETFALNLSAPTNAILIAASAVGTINDDDPLPSLSINNVTVKEGDSGTTNAVFKVTLSQVSGQIVTVDYATSDVNTTAGSDYSPVFGTLTFAPGVTNQTISVVVKGDTLNEADETFVVKLARAVNAAIGVGQGTGTITNDDAPPSITLQDVALAEGDSGTVDAVFTLLLSGASGQTVTVDYATADGTATAGSDYLSASGKLTFLPGTSAQTVAVKVVGDTVFEPNETFFLNLTLPTNATLARSQAKATIFNDDSSVPLVLKPDGLAVGKDGPRVFQASELLGNDTGAPPLRIQGFDTTGTKGTVKDNGDGTFTYDPAGKFNSLLQGQTATDRFSYRANDGTGASSAAQVTVTIVWTLRPILQTIATSTGATSLTASALPGTNCSVEFSNDLRTWQQLVTKTADQNGMVQVSDLGKRSSRFYRIKALD